MSSALSALASTAAGATGTSTVPLKNKDLASEETFLKLMIAQLQNQDPLKPVDSTQFVTQLAQYSSLEQLIGIKKGTDNLLPPTTAAAPVNATTSPVATTPPPVTVPRQPITTA